MNTSQKLQISNIIGLLLVLTLNTLAVTLPIGGRTTGEISDLYPNLFVPAGYAFSIWSLIYILLITFTVMQARGLFSSRSAPEYIATVGWWFFISCLANASWIIAWHYLLVPASLLLMLAILVSLMMIYVRLDINYFRSNIPFFVRLAFSVYMGWITVATVANVTALLVSIGWRGGGISEISWTVAMISIAAVIGLYMLWQRRDLPFVAVLAWAFYAIAVKRLQAGIPEEGSIINTVYISIGLFTVTALARFLVKSKRYV